jgi:hypothetical protein
MTPSSAFASAFASRRAFIGGSLGLLTFIVAGCEKRLSPAEAKAQAVPLRTLSEAEGRSLEALGEILLPGAATAGLAQYVDHQLSGPPADSMLMLKYLGVAPPFTDFYKTGLAGAEAAAQAAHSKSLAALDAKQGEGLVGAMAQGKIEGWSGPPAGLFYFTLRSDAVDVVYGTMKGFEQLGVPYMPHIPPQSRWGE